MGIKLMTSDELDAIVKANPKMGKLMRKDQLKHNADGNATQTNRVKIWQREAKKEASKEALAKSKRPMGKLAKQVAHWEDWKVRKGTESEGSIEGR